MQMRRSWTRGALALAIGLLVCPGRLAALPFCSLIPTPSPKHAGLAYFLGRATTDTIAAGAGAVHAQAGSGHFGPAAAREIYGQVVVVERGGDTAASRGLEAGRRVVVVPWDYDSMCTPVPWGRSARWLEAGRQRFFAPRLRERRFWVRDLPTFDVFAAQSDVHPSDYPDPVFPDEDAPAPAESLFAFYRAMPTLDDEATVGAAELAALRQVVAEHPALVRRSPIPSLLNLLAYRADETRLSALRPPMAGTYRVVFTLPGGETRTITLRTADRPSWPYGLVRSDEYWSAQPNDPLDDPLGTRIVGFNLPFWTAFREADLPTRSDSSGRSHPGSWGWHIAWPDSVRSDGAWPAEIDPWEFRDLWGRPDVALDWVYTAHERWFDRMWDSGDLPVWLGRFTTGTTPLRFTESIPLGQAGEVRVEAERISPVTVRAVPLRTTSDTPPDPPSAAR